MSTNLLFLFNYKGCISFAESIKCVQCSSCQQTWDNSTDASTNCTVGFDAVISLAYLKFDDVSQEI